MSWKFFAILILGFGVLLASCSPNPDVDAQDWPDDNDIATMIALTLTQRQKDGLQNTPQPVKQENETTTGNTATGSQSSPVGVSTNEGDEGEIDAPSEGNTGETPVEDVNEPSIVETPSDQVVNEEETEGPVEEESEPPVEVAGIPGFNALDLVERLVGFGFDCSEPENQVEGSYKQQCFFDASDYRFTVTIWGRMAESIDLIEATAFYFGDMDYTGLTSVVFATIAEIQYVGAVPDDAKDWVSVKLEGIQQIGDEAFDEFGGVRYYLYALPSVQVLEIGQME